MRVAIIGAGLAGAAAARALRAAGADPVLFDKGRGPGGRLSTKRVETPAGEMRFDHGCQFVTAVAPSFVAFLQSARSMGAAAEWTGRLVSIDRYGNTEPLDSKTRWTGMPGMNALVRAALDDLPVVFGRRAVRLSGGPGAHFVLFEDGGREGPFDRVALTLPPEQLIEFLARSDGDYSALIGEAREAVLTPCWTVMTLVDPQFDPGFDGASVFGGGVRWIAREAARPGRPPSGAWVLQASPDWSAGLLEETAETIIRMLMEEAFVRFGLPQPVWSAAHRWRYALVKTAAGAPAALDPTATVGVGGDWRLGQRAEHAWLSGEALGAALAGERA